MKTVFRALVVLVAAASLSFGQDKGLVVGFDASVLVGKVKMVDGGVKSVIGVSPGLGIGYKSYFSPLTVDNYSLYWNVGTDVLILPFIGIGADYRVNVSNLPLYAGVNVSSRLVGLLIPIPSINVGIYF